MMPNEQSQEAQPQPGQEAGGGAPENPILEAVRTIATYIAGLNEQGDPAGPELQNIMSQFVQVLQKGGGGMPQGQGQQPGGQPQPQAMGQAQAPGGGRGINPMMGNLNGVRQNRGQVSVI